MNSLNIPTDFGPDSGGRVKGLTIVKPIVYGNIARSIQNKNCINFKSLSSVNQIGITISLNPTARIYNNAGMLS